MLPGRKSAGHPVDIATGVVYSVHEDINIPGSFPLKWERRYGTAQLESEPGALGPGWTVSYFSTLKQVQNGFEFVGPEGGVDFFDDPEGEIAKGGTIINFPSCQELAGKGADFIVTRWDVQTYEITRFIFAKGKAGEFWPLQRMENVSGQGLDLQFDQRGRLIGVHQGIEKRNLIIAYNRNDNISSISVVLADTSRHVLVQYDYDERHRLTAAYNALGHADRYVYSNHHQMVREFVKDGAVYEFDYDDHGRCIQTSGTDGYDRKIFRYHDLIGRTEVKDSHGQITYYHWRLETGQIVEEIKPTGAVYTTKYDEFDRITSKTNTNGSVTSYAYDSQGNRCRIINSLGQTIEVAFNACHQPEKLVNSSGHVWRRNYNENNQVISIENPIGNRYRFRYGNLGNLVEIIDPLGHTIQQKFTHNGLLQSVSDWMGNVTNFRTDGFGRISEAVDPIGNSTKYHFDVQGNLIKVDYADGTSITAQYDASGNIAKVIDRNGNATRYEYAPCNRLRERVDALGNSIRLFWDSEPRRLASVANSKGEVYRYQYDAAGNVNREIGFDGRELKFEYDLYGNLIAFQNGIGERVEYERDALGRLSRITLPNGERTIFAFDDAGFLVQAGNDESNINFVRDSLGRIVREIQNGHIIERDFDDAGNLRQLRSGSEFTVDYQVDANHLIEQVRINDNDTIQFNRDARGAEVQRFLPGRIRLDQNFDAMGRLIEQTAIADSNNPFRSVPNNSTPLIQRNYQYIGEELTRIIDGFWGTTALTYDPLQRLTQALRDFGENEQFSYDENDNITGIKQDGAGSELEYGPGDRLVQCNGVVYTHDDQGRRIRKIEILPDGGEKTWQYTWDALDQLRTVKNPEGQTWRYTYDVFGRRIKKESPEGKTLHFIWDEDVVLHELSDESELTSWLFDPLSFSPLCKLEGDAFYAIITDQAGTPREMIDRQGRIVWQVDYKAWKGVRKKHKADLDCPIRLAGQWYDNESDLCYNRFRYYDAESGRFISSDPIRLNGGANQYTYAPNAVSWIDPLGLESVDPNSINFSQRTVSDIRVWDEGLYSPIRVMDVDGQLVSYDNRRLLAAQNAGVPEIEVVVVKPNDIMPGSKKTWRQAFQRRLNDRRNVAKGETAPAAGWEEQPELEGRKSECR